jgi:hypothetical protein
MKSVALLLSGLLLLIQSVVAAQESPKNVGESLVDSRLEADRVAIDKEFLAELQKLASKCDDLKLPAEAEVTRKWYIPRRNQVQYHFLPDFFARDVREKRLPGAPGNMAPENARLWWNRFLLLRQNQGKRLFELAKKRFEARRLQESFALLHEVLREDMDHTEARRILGYTGKANAWSPQERTPKYSSTARIDSTFNWAPNRHGIVDSAHFRLRTNADAKAAIEAATYLEECHDVWRIIYSGFWLDPKDFKTCWEGGAAPTTARSKEKLEVILFASREEYVSQLKPFEKNIAQSLGYYAPGRKTSFFYLEDGNAEVKVNWAHEVSHQLFSAYSRNPPGLTKNANFWVIEGAAMYMESLVSREGYWTSGGFESQRLQDARYRQRNMKEHATLRELLPLGQEPFQRDPRIRELYTAGAGFTHFFLDGEKGKNRDGFLRFLRQIYDEQDTADLLEKEIGVSTASIDEAYPAFLDVTDADLEALSDLNVKRLVLGRTSVTSQGLSSLRKLNKLRRLDLTDLRIENDDGLSFLAADCDLSELSLFGVQVTSGCGERLAKMKSLKELNLSRTLVDDKVMASLAKLPSLESLALSDTAITDAAEVEILQMKRLKELDVALTKITPQCVERMKNTRPGLTISP